MSRSHELLIATELAPQTGTNYTVPAGQKVIVSALTLTSLIILGVACQFEFFYQPSGGSQEQILYGQIDFTQEHPNPFPLTEPWWTLYAGDDLTIDNVSIVGGPNLHVVLSAIVFDPP
jgi:hypothetical protein